MAKCKNCGQEFEAKRSTAMYCSDKCRKLAFQKDAKISVPVVSVPAKSPESVTDIPVRYFTDATGVQHQVDYKGRREVQALLVAWYDGKGTPYQQRLAVLGRQYSVIKGINNKEFLGLAA